MQPLSLTLASLPSMCSGLLVCNPQGISRPNEEYLLQAREELLEARGSIDELSTRLALAESRLQANTGLESDLRNAESRHAEELSVARREKAELRSSLESVSQERDKMQEQVRIAGSSANCLHHLGFLCHTRKVVPQDLRRRKKCFFEAAFGRDSVTHA